MKPFGLNQWVINKSRSDKLYYLYAFYFYSNYTGSLKISLRLLLKLRIKWYKDVNYNH